MPKLVNITKASQHSAELSAN